jgi:hypothetical protein
LGANRCALHGAATVRETANQVVRQIVDRLYGGSVERLLLGMIDDRIVSGEQLEELARKVTRAEEQEQEELQP